MKTTDELVRELVDREAIRDLPVLYCDCLRRKDVDGLLALFTDDATFVMKGIEVEAVSRGSAEIRRMHQKAVAKTNPQLFVHTQIVNLLGADRATGRCAVEVRNVTVTLEWLGLGYFEDEYAKVGDQWKFTSRYHTFDGLDDKLYLRTFMP
ncbi:MAG: nuclear transport factor 2 family protein [Candidatus Binataceae bacterium]